MVVRPHRVGKQRAADPHRVAPRAGALDQRAHVAFGDRGLDEHGAGKRAARPLLNRRLCGADIRFDLVVVVGLVDVHVRLGFGERDDDR